MSAEESEGSDREDWEDKDDSLAFNSPAFDRLLEQLDVVPPRKQAKTCSYHPQPKSPYSLFSKAPGHSQIHLEQADKSRRPQPIKKLSIKLKMATKPNPNIVANISAIDSAPTPMHTTDSLAQHHSYDTDCMALVPPDKTQIWHTQIAFTLKPNEK